MDYQEDGNKLSNSVYGLLNSAYVLLNSVYGLLTISKRSMFYGLQYNEDFYKEKASLYFIYFIL